MSLNKTLGRLFDEVRREAKRNPAFADRLDAALRAHVSARDVDDALVEEMRTAPEAGADDAADFNPVALFVRDGEDGLRVALDGFDVARMRRLIAEHNLDPAGETDALDAAGVADHIVRFARKRIERDRKLFDY